LKIENLEYFLSVVQHGSINRAAEELFLTQQNLGVIIRNIENEIGCELLVRTSRGVHLTSEGERFLPYAQNIVSSYNTFLSEKRPQTNVLTIYSTPALANELDRLQGVKIADRYYLSLQNRSPADLLELMQKKAEGYYFVAVTEHEKNRYDMFERKTVIYQENSIVYACHQSSSVSDKQNLKDIMKNSLKIRMESYDRSSGDYLSMNNIDRAKQLMRENDAVFICAKNLFDRNFHEPNEWVVLHENNKINVDYMLFTIGAYDKQQQESMERMLRGLFEQ